MKKTTVVVGFRLEPQYIERLNSGFPDVEFRVSKSKSDMLEMVADAEVFFGWPHDDAIAAGKKLRWLHLLGAGADGFSAGPVAERGIVVTNNRGVAASNIAEHVLGLMLTFARSLHVLARAQRDQIWTRSQQLRLFELRGQTIGIVGLGAIGQALVTKAGSLGMRVLGARRSGAPTPGVERVYAIEALAELAAQSDHLVACLPGTAESAGLIDAHIFSAMKRGSYFYNVGRGGTVVTSDLMAAIEQGRVAGAGLDVVDPEPLPVGHPIWNHPDIIMTSHTAGNTEQYWERGIVLFEENLRHYLNDDPMINRVDLAKGY